MTRFQKAIADTERRLDTHGYEHLYKAGARLARTGGGFSAAKYCRIMGLTGVDALAVHDGYKAEISKPPADRRGRLG